MSKNLIKVILLFFVLVCLSACTFERGIILFNTSPITQNNALHDQKVFKEGAKVYYLFIAPKKLTNPLIRVQVFTITDKDYLGGEEVVRTKDIRLMQDERYYYTDYFTFWQKGKYVMQVFSHDDFTHPLAVNFFYVQ